MEFQYFDSSGCGFPKPVVPVLPPLTWHSLGREKAAKAHVVADATWRHFSQLEKSIAARPYSRGRYALFDAYRLSGIGNTGALLAPAYHCSTMLDPAIRLNAEIDFYPLTADLAPDLEAISVKLKSGALPYKAVLVTHFFGFPQQLAALASLCKERGIALIEDCSHALFSPMSPAQDQAENAVGETGRYAIASPYKFFPSEDGGLLWENESAPMPTEMQPAPSLVAELKGLLSSVRRARENCSGPSLAKSANAQSQTADPVPVKGREILKPGTALSIYYERPKERIQSLASSRWIIRHTNVARLANLRRSNYQRWVDAVSDLPHCHALLPQLPQDCVPYMFPLFIDDPDVHFYALKHIGVPIWRWDDMAVSSCSVSKMYRLQLLHLPCHQELCEAQLAWMIRMVSQVMHGEMTVR